MKEKLTFGDLKELLNRIPKKLDDTYITMVVLDENGAGESYPIQTVVYGEDVSLWSPRQKDKKEEEKELRKLMQDPKYWKHQDPETVKRVEEGFKRLYG